MSVFLSAFIFDIFRSSSPNRLFTRSIVLENGLFVLRLKSIAITSVSSTYFTGVCTPGIYSLDDTELIRDLLYDSISLFCF